MASSSADLIIRIDGLAVADAEAIQSTLTSHIAVTLWGVIRDTRTMTNRLFGVLAGTLSETYRGVCEEHSAARTGKNFSTATASSLKASQLFASVRPHFSRSSSADRCALALSMVRMRSAEYVELLDTIHRERERTTLTAAVEALLDSSIRLHSVSVMARRRIVHWKDG